MSASDLQGNIGLITQHHLPMPHLVPSIRLWHERDRPYPQTVLQAATGQRDPSGAQVQASIDLNWHADLLLAFAG